MSDKINRIRILPTNSNRVRHFGISQRVSAVRYDGERNYTLKDVEERLRPTGDTPRQACDFAIDQQVRDAIADILQIEGIVDVTMRPYEMNVRIATSLDWEDVQETIADILSRRLFDGNVDVQDRTQPPAEPPKQ